MFPIEEFRDTVGRLIEVLRRHSIRFQLTGGAAAMAYSDPRMTQDIDWVVERERLVERLDDFLADVRDRRFLFSETAVRTAVARGKSFQLLDLEQSLKLDLYPHEIVPGQLDRSVDVELFAGMTVPVISRLDLTIAKLVWISLGSHKSRRDVRWLWRDLPEPERLEAGQYVEERGLGPLLQEVLNESDEIDA